MRILHVSSLIEPLAVTPLGGTEQLIWELSKLQAADGHAVEVIAVQGSKLADGVTFRDLSIKRDSVIRLSTEPANIPADTGKIAEIIERERTAFTPVLNFIRQNSESIDVIHNHSYDYTALFGLNELGIPTVHTLHLPPNYSWINEAFRAHASAPHIRYVVVSRAMQRAYVDAMAKDFRLIPNWIDCSSIEFGDHPDDLLLWVGRVSPEKGLDRAIRISQLIGKKLLAIGPVYDDDYYRSVILPLLTRSTTDYVGAKPRHYVLDQMGKARALIAPISWEEPFGLVFVESLASGTPVVVSPRGAALEIIEEGANGFLAISDEDFASSIEKLDEISRSYCRQSVETRFNPSVSLGKYYELYRELADCRPPSMQK
ncbi:MAG: glycosyltransferase [Bdellovibrionales bacterium]|nr:glycosyltransferase [Bdellovibrionales bacterium]